MKAFHLRALGAAMAALPILAAAGAHAQQIPTGGPLMSPPPSHGGGMHGMGGGRGGFRGGFGFPFGYYVDREYVPVVVKEVVREPPAEQPAPAPPPAPRKPYVIGSSYSSLPGGCLKLIENGVSYYQCSGRWYREVGGSGDARYKAVTQP